MNIPRLPSIWLGSFSDHDTWERASREREAWAGAAGDIDDAVLASRHPIVHRAWCVVCQSTQPMSVIWRWARFPGDGTVLPRWTEIARCGGCRLNSRMRALVRFLQEHPGKHDGAGGFIAEQFTDAFPVLQSMLPGLIGSEYLGPEHAPGQITAVAAPTGAAVRHEDLTRLSLDDRSVGIVVHQDVLEHIPDYPSALRECLRVLRRGGRMVFTTPFDSTLATTRVRASVKADGTIEHHLPPELHGDPLGTGALCFHDFGWDLLDQLRAVGFRQAAAHMYWGPWSGHFGGPSFVLEAVR